MNLANGGDARKRPATLKEIAELTGVHISTVSRVLRQSEPPDGWSDAALRIRQTAQDLGYQPNPWAASLRTRRTKVVGAVMSRLDDGVIATMFTGVQQASEDAGYSVIMSSPADSPEAIRHAVELISSRQVDGLIISSVHRPSGDLLNSLNTSGAPIVLLSRHADSQLPSVTGDDRQGGLLAARHLIELGHHRLGVVAGPAHASTAHDRVRGFLEGVAEARLSLPDDVVVPSEFEVAGGVDAANVLLRRSPRPTAVFAVNDTAAIGVLGVARDLGLRVPDDLSVVGFNDIPVVSQLPVPLTTIRSQAHEMGATAARQLLRMVGDETVESVTLPVELVVRASTGPAPRETSGA